MFPCERDELARLLNDCAAFGRARDRDASAAPEVEQSLLAKRSERAQDSVRVDAEHCGQVLRRRKAFAGFGFAFGDGAADLGGDLFVQVGSALGDRP
jgi:hypothetical protein